MQPTSQPCWIASSTSGDAGSAEAMELERFPNAATGFDLVDRRITPWPKRSSTLRKATNG